MANGMISISHHSIPLSHVRAALCRSRNLFLTPYSSLVLHCSGSGDDCMDSLLKHRCPPTPSLSPQKRATSQSKTEPPLLRTNKRTIYTAGRPPWYNVTGTTFKEAFVIGQSKQKTCLFQSHNVLTLLKFLSDILSYWI